ncbi:MAG: hypothetical protein ACLP9L_25135 [Thermoguttaceae bacterium]
MKTQLQTHLSGEAHAVLSGLWKAFACARDLKIDPWEFSLPLLHLVDLGVDKSNLRWLVLHGYVTFRDRGRRCQPGTNVASGSDPRFLITQDGALVAGAGSEGADCPSGRSANSAETASSCSVLPRWDRKLRLLSFDGYAVKQFRLPASNQEAVLSTFEAEGWPPSIDDPLPFVPGLQPKERLHVTIRHLNANHQTRLIRFRGNGTGEAVLWGPIAASAVQRPAATLEFAPRGLIAT